MAILSQWRMVRILIVVLMGIVLGGCASSSSGCDNTAAVRPRGQIESLVENGVQVIRRGDNLTLILPIDRFFLKDSTVLAKEYRPILDDIAAFLASFEKTGVKVAGYTDSTQWPLHNIALSRQQAEVVADYLWHHGVDARFLSATGYGEQMPIANNATKKGRAMNRRIEITLQLVTEPDDL